MYCTIAVLLYDDGYASLCPFYLDKTDCAANCRSFTLRPTTSEALHCVMFFCQSAYEANFGV